MSVTTPRTSHKRPARKKLGPVSGYGDLALAVFAPPLVEPFQPSLTLPYLSAQLRDMGFEPRLHNLSSLFYVWLFRRARLDSMPRYRELSEAVATLRDPARFFEPAAYETALARLEAYVTSLSDHAELPYSLFPGARASVVEGGASLGALVEALRGTLLERFLVDYVGFTVQLENYHVIGFSATNLFQLAASIFIARLLKSAGVEAHLALGGHAVSVAGDAFVGQPSLAGCFDSITLGGGADVFATLCDDFIQGRPKRVYLPHDVAARFRFRRSSFPTDRPYALTLQHDIDDLYLSPQRVFSIYSALGCSFGECTFCGSNRANAPYVPRHTPVLVDEIESLERRYGLRHFVMCDNNFDPKRSAAFCKELERRGRSDTLWQCTSRVYDSLDLPLLQRLRTNGCVMMNIGLESGSDRILAAMRKGYTAAQIERLLLDMERAGMPAHLYCICAYPGELPEDSQQTLALLRRHLSRCHSVYFQNYEGQLASKVFADALGNDSQGYDSERMLAELLAAPEAASAFRRHGSLLRRCGYPLIEDHNFLYLAHEHERARASSSPAFASKEFKS